MNDSSNRTILLKEYQSETEPTDRMPKDRLEPVLQGLFGEVGSIMAAVKKYHREQEDYIGRRQAILDEFGDTLWYFSAVCRRLGIGIDEVFCDLIDDQSSESEIAASDMLEWPVVTGNRVPDISNLDVSVLRLGQAMSTLLGLTISDRGQKPQLVDFAKTYVAALQQSGLAFADVARFNIAKTRGRFLKPETDRLPKFDDIFSKDEQIPSKFAITITQRKSGKSYLQWRGVFIGDPLTDNIRDKDGYRYHDVFHLAHAAVLHWSPVFRALIKHKRKSDPSVDEAQDGGRAIVIEEGLTAWIFSQAKRLGFFEKRSAISFDILKTVQQFVAGYEVDECPLSLWEDAILQGYEAFRKVQSHQGGVLIGDRDARTLTFRPAK